MMCNSLLLVRKRDRAHLEIKNIFYKVIQKRRSSGEKVDDILQTLIDATYKYVTSSHSFQRAKYDNRRICLYYL